VSVGRMVGDRRRRSLDALSERERETDKHGCRNCDDQSPHETILARRLRLPSWLTHSWRPPDARATLHECDALASNGKGRCYGSKLLMGEFICC
jgi:hypothetical protein